MRYIISPILASVSLALPALAEVPRVVTDLPPVHALTAQVMGDLGQPVLLLDRGANAHSFQLRPSQAADLAGADLVIWVGPQMTPWLERGLTALGAGAAQLTLLDAPGTHRQDFPDRAAAAADGDDHDDHGHDDHDHDDHGHDDHAAEGHDEHDHKGLDPHAWLDPHNGAVWLRAIAAELAARDPANAATYAANAEAAAARLTALEAELAATLAPAKGRPFVVAHDAYSYFADHFGLTIAGAIRLGDATEPGAAHLAELRAALDGAVCVFPEAAHDPKAAEVLVEGTPVKVGGTLDPAASLMEPGPALYEALLREMAGTLASCLAP